MPDTTTDALDVVAEIVVFDKLRHDWRIRKVAAQRTSSPRFVVHRTSATDGLDRDIEGYGWAVTHLPTGMSAACLIDTLEAARLIACIVDALPLPYDRLTRESYIAHYLHQKRLDWWSQACAALPEEIQRWLHLCH